MDFEYAAGRWSGAGIVSLLLLLSFLLPALPLSAQTSGGDAEVDTTYSDDWDDVDLSQGETAEPPGSFGLYFGPTFEYLTLETASLDPDLDQSLFMWGGYGYVIVSRFLIGGGGSSVTLEQPNERYDRFSFGYNGFLTGYDHPFSPKFSARLSLLVGSGEIEMIKTRNDLDSLGNFEFLERFRAEEFFLVRPGFSIGYSLFGILDLRAQATRLIPIGGARVGDLESWSFGINAMFGFRNSIF